MTDVPPGNGRPGDDPEPYVPSGVRRSSYTPPPADAEPPAFDDDALADALAAQVSSYTAPVPITPPSIPVVDVPEFAEPAVAHAPVGPAPVDPAPAEPVPADSAPAAAEPVSIPEPAPESGPSATLEAIERLENELRRRAEESQSIPIVDATPVVDPPPVFAPEPGPEGPHFPAPPTFLRPAPADAPTIFTAPAAPAPTFPEPISPVPAPVEQAPVLPEPPVLPAPPVVPVAEPAEPPSWGAPAPAVEVPAAPPVAAPPPLVEPPALVEPPTPTTGSIPVPSFAPPAPAEPTFGSPPASPPVDLPPPGSADFAHLPPPIGIEPAALPPYDPTGQVTVPTPPRGVPLDLPAPPGGALPPPTDFDALLGSPDRPSAPHPDDLGAVAPLSEDDDAVDEIDRAFGTGAIVVDSTGAVNVVHPPSQPIPTTRLAEGEPGLVDEEPESHPPLTVETAGPEPTALDLRAGRAARMFWLWFAANSSVITLSLGAVLFGLGMSVRQVLIAIVLGIALSFLPLGLGTLAGKWSGQPMMIVSRATFGLVGNTLPAVLALVSRVFWGAALLWVLASGVARVLVDSGLDVGLGEQVWTFVGLGVGFALTFVIAIVGYGLIARVQLVLSILTGLLVAGVIVLTWPRLDLTEFQSIDDGSWTLLITGVVLVFSFIGLAWVHSTADLARYQRTDSDGGSTMLWATFGATLPALALLVWGALLAASDPLIADGLATNPLYTIAALLPLWYPAPLLAALSLGLLSGAVLTIYSGGFALQSLGVRLRRSGTTAIAGLIVLLAAVALVVLVGDARGLIREFATTIAVPVAAWAGIFGAEMMIRRNGFAPDDLLRRGGIYPAVRWVNLVGLLVIAALGFGLTSAEVPGLDWQGYLLPFLGLPAGDPLLTSDVGVLVALVLGILLPLITAVPTIRRQEEPLADGPGSPRSARSVD